MVREDGVLKLMDFGIAKILDRDERMTMTGALVGSPAHMAPGDHRGRGGGRRGGRLLAGHHALRLRHRPAALHRAQHHGHAQADPRRRLRGPAPAACPRSRTSWRRSSPPASRASRRDALPERARAARRARATTSRASGFPRVERGARPRSSRTRRSYQQAAGASGSSTRAARARRAPARPRSGTAARPGQPQPGAGAGRHATPRALALLDELNAARKRRRLAHAARGRWGARGRRGSAPAVLRSRSAAAVDLAQPQPRRTHCPAPARHRPAEPR